MVTAGHSTHQAGTALCTCLSNQIDFASSGAGILRHWDHQELIVGTLSGGRGDNQLVILAALWTCNCEVSRAHITVCRSMRDQTNHSLGNKLDIPRVKVHFRAVTHQVGADGRDLRTCTITPFLPTQHKLLFPSIARTVTLRTDELKGDDGGDR